MIQPDPDPRVPDGWLVDEDELWDPQAAAWVPRPSALPALLIGALAGAISGFVLGILIATVAHG